MLQTKTFLFFFSNIRRDSYVNSFIQVSKRSPYCEHSSSILQIMLLYYDFKALLDLFDGNLKNKIFDKLAAFIL